MRTLEISVKLDEERIIRIEGSLGERPQVTCQLDNPNDYPIEVKKAEGVYIGELPRVTKLSQLYDDINRGITETLLKKHK